MQCACFTHQCFSGNNTGFTACKSPFNALEMPKDTLFFARIWACTSTPPKHFTATDLFPKCFGDRQPGPTRPHAGNTTKWLHICCPDSASAVRFQGVFVLYTWVFSGYITTRNTCKCPQKPPLWWQKQSLFSLKSRARTSNPTKLHFTATKLSQNILMISSPAQPDHTLKTKKTGAYRFPERTRLTFFGTDSVYNAIKAILTKRVFLLSTSFAANSIDTVLYKRGIRNRRWAPLCPKLLYLNGLS